MLTQANPDTCMDLSPPQRLLKNMKFEGIQRLSSYQILSSAISIPSNFIFFKSLCGGEIAWTEPAIIAFFNL